MKVITIFEIGLFFVLLAGTAFITIASIIYNDAEGLFLGLILAYATALIFIARDKVTKN
jgi:hypothetical protein